MESSVKAWIDCWKDPNNESPHFPPPLPKQIKWWQKIFYPKYPRIIIITFDGETLRIIYENFVVDDFIRKHKGSLFWVEKSTLKDMRPTYCAYLERLVRLHQRDGNPIYFNPPKGYYK